MVAELSSAHPGIGALASPMKSNDRPILLA
jgi:hypothetical protein